MEKLPLIETELLQDVGGLPEHSDHKLSKRQKFLYGVCETGVQAVKMVEGFYFTVFLLEVANVHPILVGNIMLIGQVWDAIAHPIVGKLTDHTKSRWGRRRPWILLSAIPYAAAYFALWQVPDIENEILQFIYYLGVLMLLNTFDTCISVPFTAMTPELANSYDEATELTTFRQFICILWGIVATFAHSMIISSFPSETNPEVTDYKKGYFVSALVIGLSLIPAPMAYAIFIKEKHTVEKFEEFSSEPALKRAWTGIVAIFSTFKSRAFLLAMGVYFLCLASINFVQNNALLYMKYVLHREEHFQWFILVVQGVSAASIIMWAKVSNKIGKQKTFYIGISFLVITHLSLLFLPAGVNIALMYIIGVSTGLGIGVASLIPWSFLPDVINQDELDTGLKREGVFYSIFVLFQRAGVAVALAASSYILSMAGYINPNKEPGSEDYQPESVITALRIMLGVIPAALLGLSYVFVWFYPLTKEKVEEIQIKLKEMRKKA